MVRILILFQSRCQVQLWLQAMNKMQNGLIWMMWCRMDWIRSLVARTTAMANRIKMPFRTKSKLYNKCWWQGETKVCWFRDINWIYCQDLLWISCMHKVTLKGPFVPSWCYGSGVRFWLCYFIFQNAEYSLEYYCRPRWLVVEMVYAQNALRASQAGYRYYSEELGDFVAPPHVPLLLEDLLVLSLHRYDAVRT